MKLKLQRRSMLAACVAVSCLAAAPMSALAQPKPADVFQAHLSPSPVPDGAPTPINGVGSVTATLNGQTLTVDGQFTVDNTTATGAHLMRGTGIGIPGPALPNIALTVNGGKLTGSVKLARDQVQALREGRIYVQVDSAKSPAPMGHLWGWLLPAQEKVAEGVPQMGGWYLAQGEGVKAAASNRKSK